MVSKTHFYRYLLVACGLFLLMSGCVNYYKTVNRRSANSAMVDSLQQQNRYFVLRNGNIAFYMRNLALSQDRKTLQATLDSLPAEHRQHLTTGIKGKLRYKKSDPTSNSVLNEVHLYIAQDNTAVVGNRYTLELDEVQKIEIIEKDKKRTTNSYVIGAVGITLGTFVLSSIIILATKSSCPFVSAYDGNEFSLQGEIYGGAIYPQLARHDYLPLKMAPMADGSLQVKISNELQERQYTDAAELWVATHDKNTQVLVDEKGNLYSIKNPEAPVWARLNNNKEVTNQLRQIADHALLYMDDTSNTDARNELVVAFKKKPNATKGKLILHVKNSYFLDLLYGELAKGFGSYYPAYIKKQQTKPASELLQWVKDQQIPLTVSVKNNKGWQSITQLTTVGPLALRQIAVPINIPEDDNPTLEIKLSSGFMFWEIDYAALDFTADEAFQIQKLMPVAAVDESGKNVLPLFKNEDGQYLMQPQIGNVATITYTGATLPGANETQSFFLKAKGYYEHIRNFKNGPNVTFLKGFTKPSAFPKYGMALYKKMSEAELKSWAQRSN